MNVIKRNLKELKRYPSAMVGLVIIVFLLAMSVYTVIKIPYNEAVRLWRGGEDIWAENPKNAWPVWYNWISSTKLPETLVLDSRTDVEKSIEQTSEDIREENFTFTIDFPYDKFPPEMIMYVNAEFEEKPPFISMTWLTPDGREIRVGDITPRKSDSYRFAQDTRLQRRLGGLPAEQGLFAVPDSDPPVPLKGTYQLQVEGLVFEDNSSFETKLVMYGDVHGLAGTDHRRRDLMVALLWGIPIAMAFGLLAAVGTTVTTMAIAAIGVWFGGALDSAIQRITEVNLILPLLPILIMIGTFYSRSIWVMLGVVILLSIFGAAIKNYRAIFLQVRVLPYIEAAQAYGASNLRVVFRYLIPRVLPLVIPNLVILVPGFVFLEASLAVLGLGDPVLPTWGKIIQDANAQGALFNGYYYWILEPSILLMIAGLAFAMVGYALDRIFNPRLREL
ncbi:MAG: ABC transporter permease [Candidatus Promineifilaceae bacterium]